MKPRLLLIAPHGSYRTAPYIEAAHRLGAEVLVASEGRFSVVSSYAEGLHIEPGDPEAALALILAEATRRPFVGIVATDDGTTELAARAASALGLAHNPPQAVALARRKDQARACLQAAGVVVPRHALLDLTRPLSHQLATDPVARVGFPAVIKPLALSGSRGVIRVDTPAELEQAGRRVQAILARETSLEPALRGRVLLEAFIPGREVAVEGMLRAGCLEILTVFDKPDPLDGPFFEETYYITPPRLSPERKAAICETVSAACVAYGLREGPVHAECRLNAQGVWILEVAARTIGGLCARLLRFGTGYGLEELVIAQAMGRRLTPQYDDGAAGVLMIPIPQAGLLKRVEGILAAQRVEYIEDVQIQIQPGHEVTPLPEGASYLGFVFARGPTSEHVEAALRAAHACLNIVIAPLWRIGVA